MRYDVEVEDMRSLLTSTRVVVSTSWGLGPMAQAQLRRLNAIGRLGRLHQALRERERRCQRTLDGVQGAGEGVRSSGSLPSMRLV